MARIMATPPPRIEAALQLYRSLVLDDPILKAEFLDSSDEFFRGSLPAPEGSYELGLAERRHLEWFVAERHSPCLFGVPTERMSERIAHEVRRRADAGEAEAEVLTSALDAVGESLTGVFVVSEVRLGEGAWLEDLAGFGEYPLSEPDGASALEKGDLIVGRLFPIGDALYLASPAAGVFRNAELLGALRRDLAETRAAHTAKVLHVSQLEIETMFFGAGSHGNLPSGGVDARASASNGSTDLSDFNPDAGPLTVSDPVGETRKFLTESGLAASAAEGILDELAAAPFDPNRLVHGARDTLGDILVNLAFDTSIDLERARVLLQQAWARLSQPPAPARTPKRSSGPRDVREAVDAFAQGRERGEDIAKLITDLERDLALDPDDEPDPDELAPAPDFPGVVGAMVEEFLWDIGLENPKDADRHREPLQHLAEFGANIGVFEDLTAAELLRLTTFWIHERETLRGREEAVALVDALDSFCAWTATEHEMPLAEEFQPTLTTLRESLPRLVMANRELSVDAAGDSGELFELRSTPDEPATLIDRDGETHMLAADSDLPRWLIDGDRVRGRVAADGTIRVFRCYPPESAALMV